MSAAKKLAEQFKFLRRIRDVSEEKLREVHRRIFWKTKFYVKIPKWMHRSIMERRLFYYYCVKNYHYPKEHPIAIEFAERARFILSKEYVSELDPVMQARQNLKEQLHFTETNIKAMPINEVDRYLASLSLYVEAPDYIRRKILWEWFHKPSNMLIEHFNEHGIKVARRMKGSLNNKYNLRDLILENAKLSYEAFMEAFGQQMPTVSRCSFNNCRCLLRKAGYNIPFLPKGPHRPAVVSGPYGHPKKGRILNDITMLGVTNGEEDSF